MAENLTAVCLFSLLKVNSGDIKYSWATTGIKNGKKDLNNIWKEHPR